MRSPAEARCSWATSQGYDDVTGPQVALLFRGSDVSSQGHRICRIQQGPRPRASGVLFRAAASHGVVRCR
ncbi:hypothetical protein NDU88_002568 [Pleurodeles waltl]|uniref:Uncharacterized protein n=1 Tax=Pleurodeles waltl TaxID=8319 RepID=A0AAV7M2V4_PLEWA|nr:hypothetical protein NDU88_002568 [Pleurodeles waltl]